MATEIEREITLEDGLKIPQKSKVGYVNICYIRIKFETKFTNVKKSSQYDKSSKTRIKV